MVAEFKPASAMPEARRDKAGQEEEEVTKAICDDISMVDEKTFCHKELLTINEIRV